MDQRHWWEGQPQVGFTQFCSAMMNTPIPVEDVTEREAEIIQRRRDVLATLVGLQQATSNAAIRRVVIRRKH